MSVAKLTTHKKREKCDYNHKTYKKYVRLVKKRASGDMNHLLYSEKTKKKGT